jgi:hypothetical protein
MKRILIALCAAVFCSCFSYDEEIWVNSDLSGTVQMNLKISQMLAGMSSMGGNGAALFSEDSIRTSIKKTNGLSLISCKTTSDQGDKIISIKIKFSSFEALKNLGAGKENMGFWGDIKVQTAGDRITFSRTISFSSSGQGESKKDSSDQMQSAMANSMFGQYAWKYIIHFPSKVIAANATDENIDRKTNTVTWNYPLMTISSGPQTMTATLQKPSSSGILSKKMLMIAGGALLLIIILIGVAGSRKKKANG